MTVRELKTGRRHAARSEVLARTASCIAYVRDHDVYVYDLATDKEQRVTAGGTEKKTHGLAEFVAQEEMNRFSGYWWSPDSKYIAYEEADADGVETWYVADPSHPERAARRRSIRGRARPTSRCASASCRSAGGDDRLDRVGREEVSVSRRASTGPKNGPLTHRRADARSEGAGAAEGRSGDRQDDVVADGEGRGLGEPRAGRAALAGRRQAASSGSARRAAARGWSCATRTGELAHGARAADGRLS